MPSTDAAVNRVLRDFADGTSMHGVPRIINARSLPAKVFWSIICIGAFSMFFWQCGILLEKYFSYPKKVNVEIVQQPVQFPYVSICNSDHIDLLVMDRLEKLYQNSSPENFTGNPTEEAVWQTFKTKYAQYSDNSSKFFQEYNEFTQDMKYTNMMDVYSRLGLTANIGPKLATAVGIKLKDFIVRCQFMDDECNVESSFVKFFDPYFFNCYTFRPESVLSTRSTRLQGVEYGLSLLLFIGSAGQLATSGEYLYMMPGLQESDPSLASGRGARVVVHSPDTQPYPTAEGYDIMPGYSVTIGVKANEMLRIQRPHGNCSYAPPDSRTSTTQPEPATPINNSHEFKHTLITCQNNCIQRAIMDACGCVDNRIGDPADFHNLTYCFQLPALPSQCKSRAGNLTQECHEILVAYDTRVECRRRIYEKMTIQDPQALVHCRCFPPCRDVAYDASYSLSTMPELTDEHTAFYAVAYDFMFNLSPVRQRILKGKLEVNTSEYSVNDFSKAFIRQHISRLNVHVADSNIVRTTESADYDATRLVSDIGGQLGLWIGISVMTLFEVLQLLADVVRFLTARGRRAGEKRVSKEKRERCSYCNESNRLDANRFGHYNDYDHQYLSTRQSDGDTRLRYEVDQLTAV